MKSEKLPRKQYLELRDRFESLDPFALKQGVEKRLKKILRAAEGTTRRALPAKELTLPLP